MYDSDEETLDLKCDYCGGVKFEKDVGFYFCIECGYMNQEKRVMIYQNIFKNKARKEDPLIVTKILPTDTFAVLQLEEKKENRFYLTTAHISQVKKYENGKDGVTISEDEKNDSDPEKEEINDDRPNVSEPEHFYSYLKRLGLKDVTYTGTTKKNNENIDISFLENVPVEQIKLKPRTTRRTTRHKINKINDYMNTWRRCVKHNITTGLEIRHFPGKGRGVVACKNFKRNDFVVEYKGELINLPEAKRREAQYSLQRNTGCYMFYFKHHDIRKCIDATEESGDLGRLINHSRKSNLLPKICEVNGKPHLILIAQKEIMSGEEITFDYGDRSKNSLKFHPWLAT